MVEHFSILELLQKKQIQREQRLYKYSSTYIGSTVVSVVPIGTTIRGTHRQGIHS